MAPKAIGPDDKIPCPTIDHLHTELSLFQQSLNLDETEDTWEKIERAILRFAAVTRGGGAKFGEEYVRVVGGREMGGKIVRCMLSDRGKLSGVTTDLLTSMSPRLLHHFQPLLSLFLPPLLKLLARPNKLYIRRSEKTLLTILQYSPHASILPYLKSGVEDKSETCRRSCALGLVAVVEGWERGLIGGRGVEVIEEGVRRLGTDRDAEVRKIGRRIWEGYCVKFEERVEAFTAPLTPTIRKYLDIKTSSATSTKPSTSSSHSSNYPPPIQTIKRHPLAASTSASSTSNTNTLNRPSAMVSQPHAGAGGGGRSVSASSTMAQLGGGSGSAPGPVRQEQRGQAEGFVPFPSSSSSSSMGIEPVGPQRAPLSRSAPSAILTEFTAPISRAQAQAQGIERPVSAMAARGIKSFNSVYTLNSLTEPIPNPNIDSLNFARSSSNSTTAAPGPSRPRVISNLSTNSEMSSTSAVTNTSSGTGSHATATRRPGLTAFGSGPIRPSRAPSALAQVAEGKNTPGGAGVGKTYLGGNGPVRPNLQARVTSGSMASSGSASTTPAAAVGPKRIVSAGGVSHTGAGLGIGVGARKPILAAGLQAKLEKRKVDLMEKEKEAGRDVFLEDKEGKLEEKAGGGPEGSAAGGLVGKRVVSAAGKTAGGQERRTATASSMAKSTARTSPKKTVVAARVPQAKVELSPRKPKTKLKPPLPGRGAAAPVARVRSRDNTSPVNVRAKVNLSGPGAVAKVRPGASRDRTPFMPSSKKSGASSAKEAKQPVQKPEAIPLPPSPTPATKNASPLPTTALPPSVAVAVNIPLPPSPGTPTLKLPITSTTTNLPPQSTRFPRIFGVTSASALEEIIDLSLDGPLVAESIPLLDTDEESVEVHSPTITISKAGKSEPIGVEVPVVANERVAEVAIGRAEEGLLPSPSVASSADAAPNGEESLPITDDEASDPSVSVESSARGVAINPDRLGLALKQNLVDIAANNTLMESQSIGNMSDLIKFSSESEDESAKAGHKAQGDTAKQYRPKVISPLRERNNSIAARMPDLLMDTPSKRWSTTKRPRVKQLQDYFENFSPTGSVDEQARSCEQASPTQSPLRVRVRVLSEPNSPMVNGSPVRAQSS